MGDFEKNRPHRTFYNRRSHIQEGFEHPCFPIGSTFFCVFTQPRPIVRIDVSNFNDRFVCIAAHHQRQLYGVEFLPLNFRFWPTCDLWPYVLQCPHQGALRKFTTNNHCQVEPELVHIIQLFTVKNAVNNLTLRRI